MSAALTLPEMFRAALASTEGDSPAQRLARGSLLAMAARIPELDAIVKEVTDAEAATINRDVITGLTRKHWLMFKKQTESDTFWSVVRCWCGFEADLDSDDGYGDSVVRHLLEVGYQAARESA